MAAIDLDASGVSGSRLASGEPISLVRARRLRLRSIDVGSAAALRTLFCGRDILDTGAVPGLTWRFSWMARSGMARNAAATRSVFLQGGHGGLLLRVTWDGLRAALGCREWWDYEGESMLFAWTLAHTLLLDSLGRVLGDSLLPEDFREPTKIEREAWLALGFEARGTDRESVGGELLLPPEMLAQLAAKPGWAAPAHVIDEWAAWLRADLRVVLPAAKFPSRELDVARCGDVLVLGSRAHCWGRLAVIYAAHPGARAYPTGGAAAEWVWSARYHDGRQDDGRLEICEAALAEPTRILMSEPISQEAGVAHGGSLDGVPVTLEFEVGTLSVPLGELAAIKPGYVFELGRRLEEARVVIRANGTPVGHGELVAVGDTLAVQLVSIDAHGLR